MKESANEPEFALCVIEYLDNSAIGFLFRHLEKNGKESVAAIKRVLTSESNSSNGTFDIPSHIMDSIRERFISKEVYLTKGAVVSGREVNISKVKSVYWVTGGKVSCSIHYSFHGIAENQKPFSYRLKEQRLQIQYSQDKKRSKWMFSSARWL
jgi:hypothetical protein